MRTERRLLHGTMYLIVDSVQRIDADGAIVYASFGIEHDEPYHIFHVADDVAIAKLRMKRVRLEHGDIIKAKVLVAQTLDGNSLTTAYYIDSIEQFHV